MDQFLTSTCSTFQMIVANGCYRVSLKEKFIGSHYIEKQQKTNKQILF